MNDWKRISDFPKDEQIKLRYILRHAAKNGVVQSGAAVKFGKEWLVNPERLPHFLREHTLAVLGRERAAYEQ